MSDPTHDLAALIDKTRDDVARIISRWESERLYVVSILRSNQDTLLHKVNRNEAVREQLETNRIVIANLRPKGAASVSAGDGQADGP